MPRFDDARLQALCDEQGAAAAWLALLGDDLAGAWHGVHDDYAVVACDVRARRVVGGVDRFARHALCYRFDAGTLQFATRADEVPGEARAIDLQALFNYAYHHVIPAPRTIFAGVQRLEAAHRFVATPDRLAVERHWTPQFAPREIAFEDRRDAFVAALESAVARRLEPGTTGCYLSGGTDSSTVAGIATRVMGEPAKTFSIGFEANGYDEMGYARIAAQRFGTAHHEYYVTPEDVVAHAPAIAAAYDQPFGNSSALPAFLCAHMARERGVTRMLAGDGGDELFGGNSRYREEQLFAAYAAIPSAMRRALIEPVAATLGATGIARLRKPARFIAVARMSTPERQQRFNLLEHLGAHNVLSAALLATVDVAEPMAAQQAAYAATPADAALLDRLLAFEWKYILADNDLRKVAGSAYLAGVRPAFPLLDDRLVDLSLALPPLQKVRGMRLRHFFKEALRGFLPDEIIRKQKHGFGMPFGVWLLSHERLRAFAAGSLESLRDRGVFEPAVLDAVHRPSAPDASYYGELVWIGMMLEHWLQAHAPAFRLR
jgi:asparagine synthase (glutamine-hydrolysing)